MTMDKKMGLLRQTEIGKPPFRFLLAVIGIVLLSLASKAQADQTTLEEIGSDELLAREGITDPLKMPPRSMHEHVFWVPVDNRETRLIVTLLYPDGSGPFPLAVVNHGATGSKKPALEIRYRLTFSAYYFLSRGYAVLLPMMRGYAGSYGREGHYGCDFTSLGRDNAHDIDTVINAISGRPEIDASRIIVAGQSFGGWNTLAFGTLNRPAVVGLINFNGGVATSDCNDNDGALVENARKLAATTHLPSIWFYGRTDTVFRPKLWHAVYDAYVAQGGQAELVDIGDFFTDSHQFLSYPEALAKWVPRVDGFLERIGMPHNPVFPDYLPNPWPSASGYAAIDDVDKVPFLTDPGREIYRGFMSHALPRVIALSPKGTVAANYGGFDQVANVLKACSSKSQNACRLYAIDNDVVWQPIPDPPAPSHYAALTDASAIPYLGPIKVRFYAQFLSRPSPRALVISADGKAYGVYGAHAFEQALVNCQAHSVHCEPYVVNDDVVWSPPGSR
jgi:dienelactone hydrolase